MSKRTGDTVAIELTLALLAPGARSVKIPKRIMEQDCFGKKWAEVPMTLNAHALQAWLDGRAPLLLPRIEVPDANGN